MLWHWNVCHLVESGQGELFPDRLEGALFNSVQEDAHIFGTAPQLQLCVSSVLPHFIGPGTSFQYLICEVDGARSQPRGLVDEHALLYER